MSDLQIGPKLRFPAAETVTQTVVVYGAKGMGKTNFGAVLAEELAKHGHRFSLLDPLGVSWGLRHSADGKGRGIEVLILGGSHGDIPIEPTGGAVVADLVADEHVNVLIDISRRPNGTMWSQGERIRFVADYCARLYERQGERRQPIMQIIDEAARYIPQLIPHGSPDVARCAGAVERMVEEGRNVGIGVCLITQRSARMNKSVSELAECMVAFRTIGPNSVAAVTDWLGEHVDRPRVKEAIGQLRALPRGTALVVSPGWLNHEGIDEIRLRRTFDSSATPKGGRGPRASGHGARPDLDKYRARMAETIERVKQDDPRALRQEIARLQTAVRQATEAKANAEARAGAKVKRVEVPVLDQRTVARVVKAADLLRATSERLTLAAGSVTRAAADVGTHVSALRAVTTATPPAVETSRSEAANRAVAVARKLNDALVLAPRPVRPMAESPTDGGRGSLAERKILTALYQMGPIDRDRLAVRTGYAVGGGFNNALGQLRTRGLVTPATVTPIDLLDAGRAVAVSLADPLPRGQALRDYWYGRLSKAERAILEALCALYPGSARKEQLAEKTGYQVAGGFNNALGRLRSLGLVEGYGDITASADLFD